jgi:hypothetical protein
MKHLTTLALMINLAVGGIYAQQRPLKMTLSGSKVPTTLDLGANTSTDEVQLAGTGTLGQFTFRGLRTDETIPQSFGICGAGSGPILRVVAGGGAFHFQDGSALTVAITGGSLCVDLDHLVGHLQEMYQITGGTGRFEGVKGNLVLTATLNALVFDKSNAAVFLTITGESDGTMLGAAVRDQGQNEPQ